MWPGSASLQIARGRQISVRGEGRRVRFPLPSIFTKGERENTEIEGKREGQSEGEEG